MKVYFETIGGGAGKISLSVYVNPTKDGHGYFYSCDGRKVQFAWTNPQKAVVFDSSELPEELWYSFKHGVHHIEADENKLKDWTWDDLEYHKVEKEQVDALRVVKKKIKDVKTLDDFKELYPTIKKSNVVSHDVMDKLFSFFDIPDVPVRNGEIGIAFFQKMCIYNSLLVKSGIDTEVFL